MSPALRIFLYLIPYWISMTISAGVALYAWRRRVEKGAAYLASVAFLQAVMTLFYVFELVSPSIEGKILWDNLQFIGMLFGPILIIAFALEYSGFEVALPRKIWFYLAIIPIISLILVFTDDAHHLVRSRAWIVPGDPFPALYYDLSFAFWVMSVYAYLLVVPGLYILIRRLVNPGRLYRAQVGTIILGLLFPLGGSLLTLFGVDFSIHRDTTPITYALGNLVIAWGLFRYRLFDIIPVARDLVIDSMSAAVVVVDTEMRILDINPAALEVAGCSAVEAIGNPVERVFSNWFDLVDQFRHIEEENTSIALQEGGERRYYDITISPLPDRRGRLSGRVIVVHEITGLIKAEQAMQERTRQLEDANKELESANEALKVLSQVKDEFVANVSHELRTPITSLNMYHSLMRANPEKRESYLTTLERETNRLTDMIESLLALATFDQDAKETHITYVDLNKIVEQFGADRTLIAERNGLEMSFDFNASLPRISADPALIGQVVSILVTNAINYTPVGGRIHIRTGTRNFQDQDWVGFSIEDTGPGISSDERDLVFSRFFRGQAGRESQVPGTGLGLALAKEIVDRHHGLIELSDGVDPELGTKFNVWLPVA